MRDIFKQVENVAEGKALLPRGLGREATVCCLAFLSGPDGIAFAPRCHRLLLGKMEVLQEKGTNVNWATDKAIGNLVRFSRIC